MNEKQLAKFDRVRLSAAGLRLWKRNPDRTGLVSAEPQPGIALVSVIWDGTVTRARLHRKFLELAPVIALPVSPSLDGGAQG